MPTTDRAIATILDLNLPDPSVWVFGKGLKPAVVRLNSGASGS
jgi:hypothetical protein